MTTPFNTKPDELYQFGRKKFMCDADTIARLNYALALNHRKERYVKVNTHQKPTTP